MKPLFIAGNWKSNKTSIEAREWFESFKSQISNLSLKDVSIVLCAPFTLLSFLKKTRDELQLPLFLSAQNVSPFEDGAYTGEVSARMVKEFADWTIVGHSERRKYFHENDEMLAAKVKQAQEAGLSVIYCVPDEDAQVPKGVQVVAYEPVWAIGTGKTDTPENANAVCTAIKSRTSVQTIIYGGSVTAENVATFVAEPSIDGVLPGGASLLSQKFVGIISAALA